MKIVTKDSPLEDKVWKWEDCFPEFIKYPEDTQEIMKALKIKKKVEESLPDIITQLQLFNFKSNSQNEALKHNANRWYIIRKLQLILHGDPE